MDANIIDMRDKSESSVELVHCEAQISRLWLEMTLAESQAAKGRVILFI